MFTPEKDIETLREEFFDCWAATDSEGNTEQRYLSAKLTLKSNGYTIPNYEEVEEESVETSESISGFSFSHSCSTGGTIEIGTTCSAQINLSLLDIRPDHIPFFQKGAKFTLAFSSDDDVSYPLSEVKRTYYIDDVKIKENNHLVDGAYCADIEITAYDTFYITDKKFTPPQSPMSIRELVRWIMVTNLGDSDNSEFYGGTGDVVPNWSNTIEVTSYPEDASYRDMLGYLAGLQGCFAYCRADGGIDAKPFTALYSESFSEFLKISGDVQYQDGYTAEENVSITILESGTNDNPIVSPNTSQAVVGNTLSFENPYMTQEQLDDIYDEIISDSIFSGFYSGETALEYTPGEVEWVGCPLFNVGDVLTIEDRYGDSKLFIIMDIQGEYDGSYKETYKCFSAGEATVSFNANSAMQTINRKLSTFEKSIKEATNIINQTVGGVFEIIDNDGDGINDGWKIICTKGRTSPDDEEQELTGVHFIKATPGGIGFGTIVNGQEVVDKIGLYFDENGNGKINAQILQALQINAGQITFDQNFFNALNTGAQSSGILISQNSISGLDSELASLLGLATNANDKATAAFGLITRNFSSDTNSSTIIKTAVIDSSDTDDFSVQTGSTINVFFQYPNENSAIYAPLSLKLVRRKIVEGQWVEETLDAAHIMKTADGANITGQTSWQDGWNGGERKIFVYTGTAWQIQSKVSVTEINNIVNDAVSTVNNTKARYLTCNTGSATAIKECYLPDNNTFTISTGTVITVKFRYSGYNTSYSSNIQLKICYSNGSVIRQDIVAYNGNHLQQNSVYAWQEYGLVSFVYDGGGWVMQDNVANTVISDWCYKNDRTYINGGKIYTGTLEASAIFTGIIGKRTEGEETLKASTYFDLDNDELVTKSSTSGYSTKIRAGGISQTNENGIQIGAFCPIESESGDPEDTKQFFQGVAYNSAGANALTFGYFKDNGYYRVLEIKKGTANTGGICISKSDKFSGFTHRRLLNYDPSTGLYAGTCEARTGVGVNNVSGESAYSVALELAYDNGTSTYAKVARLDIAPNGGLNPTREEGVILQGENSRGKSKLLTLGDPDLYWNGSIVHTNANTSGSKEEYKKDIGDCPTALNIIQNSKIYSWRYKEDSDNDPLRYGTIIERECPKEIINKTGDSINLYSMLSLAWKAIQELNQKIEILEGKLNERKS